MAAGMMRISKKDLLDLLKDIQDEDNIGYLFTARESHKGPEHQVLVFFETIHSI